MSREGNLVKNTLVLSLGSVLPKISSFITLPILTGSLTKNEYGIYDLITVLCSLFLPIVTFQIQTAAFRFLIDEKLNDNNRNSIITNIFAFMLPVEIISFGIMFVCLKDYELTIKLLITLYFLFEINYNALGQVARGLSQNKIYSFGAILSSGINLGLVVILVGALGQGLKGILICMVISVALPSVFLIYKTRVVSYIRFKYINSILLKEMLRYSIPMIPNSISMWVMNASDRMVISSFLGIEANALYAVAKKIPNILTIAQGTFTMAWQESASITVKDKDADIYYTKMFDVVFCIMSGIVMLLLSLMPILFGILIKGDYGEAFNQMPILLMGMFFYSISSYLGGLFIAVKETKSVGVTTTFAAIINLVVCIFFIKSLGIYAASLSTLISFAFLMFYRMINIRKYVCIRYDIRKLSLLLIFIMVTFFLFYMQNYYIWGLMIVISVIFNAIFNKSIGKAILIKIKKCLKIRGGKTKK